MEIDSEVLDGILAEYIQEWENNNNEYRQKEVELCKAIREEIAKSDKVVIFEIPF